MEVLLSILSDKSIKFNEAFGVFHKFEILFFFQTEKCMISEIFHLYKNKKKNNKEQLKLLITFL